jgi:hypothetical protein
MKQRCQRRKNIDGVHTAWNATCMSQPRTSRFVKRKWKDDIEKLKKYQQQVRAGTGNKRKKGGVGGSQYSRGKLAKDRQSAGVCRILARSGGQQKDRRLTKKQ